MGSGAVTVCSSGRLRPPAAAWSGAGVSTFPNQLMPLPILHRSLPPMSSVECIANTKRCVWVADRYHPVWSAAGVLTSVGAGANRSSAGTQRS